MKPRIAITIGDPAGIGPEICARAVSSRRVRALCDPVVIGSTLFLPSSYLKKYAQTDQYCEVSVPGMERVRQGTVSRYSGACAYAYIEHSLKLIRHGEVDALVTAPISKEAMQAAGCRYTAHTELLAAETHSKHPVMMMSAGTARTVMVTRHLSVQNISSALSSNEIITTTESVYRYLRDVEGIRSPLIGVCALNPHAGEHGLFGDEEKRIISPALRRLTKRGIVVDGPLPADSAWRMLVAGAYDALVTMYHDQAMIPLKVADPDKVVNTTLGLPFVRTSPGHGTACDMAGKKGVSSQSMIEAICAAAIAARRSIKSRRKK